MEAAQAAGKKGLWLKVPIASAAIVGGAVRWGFEFHHAQPGYVLLVRWLPQDVPSPLPKYAFTQIGVGGVVVNGRGEVLMVQEKVSPLPIYQVPNTARVLYCGEVLVWRGVLMHAPDSLLTRKLAFLYSSTRALGSCRGAWRTPGRILQRRCAVVKLRAERSERLLSGVAGAAAADC